MKLLRRLTEFLSTPIGWTSDRKTQNDSDEFLDCTRRAPTHWAGAGRDDLEQGESVPTGIRQPSVAMASLVPSSWNQIAGWLKQIDAIRQAAACRSSVKAVQ